MTNYTQLVKDVSAYVEDKGTKFMASMPTIIAQAQLMVCRALPLERFNEGAVFSSAPGQDIILFDQIDPPIAPITVDYLLVYPHKEVVERRSQAYVRMHGGTGTPRYFCDIMGGIQITPKPIRSHSMEIAYMARPTLSAEQPSNWYTENTPDLILSAALIEADTFLVDPEMLAVFKTRFVEQLAGARRDHQDMLRANPYQPLALAAEAAPKGGAA